MRGIHLVLTTYIINYLTGLTREYESGLLEMLRLDGLPVLLHCLHSEVKKLVIKSLFMIMSYYSPATS